MFQIDSYKILVIYKIKYCFLIHLKIDQYEKIFNKLYKLVINKIIIYYFFIIIIFIYLFIYHHYYFLCDFLCPFFITNIYVFNNNN